jgi:ribonuclease P protein component
MASGCACAPVQAAPSWPRVAARAAQSSQPDPAARRSTMLPALHRMRRGADFDSAVRRGRRAGRRTLVVHVGGLPSPVDEPTVTAGPGVEAGLRPTLVGFVVAKSVGGAVVRTRVKRRLRALVSERLPQLPAGSLVVVRANPAAAGAVHGELAADLDSALSRVLRRGSESARPARASRPAAVEGESR